MLIADHLVVCVEDLDKAGAHYRSRAGLDSVAGGRHPGHGTENRIIPLGDTYIELVAVVDRAEAAESGFGRWVAAQGVGASGVHGLCLRTDDIDRDSKVLDVSPVVMSRARPDGSVLRWKAAGIEQMIERAWPFLIEWMVEPSQLPGNTSRTHPRGETSLSRVVHSAPTGWELKADGVEFRRGAPSITATLDVGGELIDI